MFWQRAKTNTPQSFSVRSRTLGSLVSGIVATAANVFWGWFYDRQSLSRPTVAKITWAFFVTLMLATFGWQTANEKLYGDLKSAGTPITLDWANPGFGRGFASMVILRFLNESHYMFVYWLIGAFFDDIETLGLAVGIVRSFESVGSCLAFGIGAAQVAPMVNLIIAFAMFGFTIPATSAVVFMVPERPINLRKLEDGGGSTSASSDVDGEGVAVAAKEASIEGSVAAPGSTTDRKEKEGAQAPIYELK